MTRATPLLQHPDHAPLAWLSKRLRGLDVPTQGLVLSNAQVLTHVYRVVESLPKSRDEGGYDGRCECNYAINLCDNRYVFMVAAMAVVVAKHTNLLPSNKNRRTQAALIDRYESVYVVHDGEAELPDDALALDLSLMDWSLAEFEGEMPRVDLDHLALISFTSGSTGAAKANPKTWRTLQESSRINARYMLPNQDEVFYHLATVPGQHMWGLETSVLLAMFSTVCLVDARPLYPHDILSLLEKLPTPRTIIATPLHLRALLAAQSKSDDTAPEVANMLCATAPLDTLLAQNLETVFRTEVREVYGCSEVGSMALRRTAQADVWNQFQGLDFITTEPDDAGTSGQTLAFTTQVVAPYLPAVITLDDTLEMLPEGQFRLSGRVTDQIKIAGKRGSLSEVNAVLNKFPGLADGVVFFPPQDRTVPRLVAIVSLASGSKESLRKHFKQYLDSAFVPRPIYVVDALPREDNGKLVQARLQAFYQDLARR